MDKKCKNRLVTAAWEAGSGTGESLQYSVMALETRGGAYSVMASNEYGQGGYGCSVHLRSESRLARHTLLRGSSVGGAEHC